MQLLSDREPHLETGNIHPLPRRKLQTKICKAMAIGNTVCPERCCFMLATSLCLLSLPLRGSVGEI